MKYFAAALLWATQLMLLAAGLQFLIPEPASSFQPKGDRPLSRSTNRVQANSSLVNARQTCLKNETSRIEISGARLEIPAGALDSDQEISLTALSSAELPELDPELVNVTIGGGGFRCLPHGTQFLKDVRFSIAFDTCLIPAGYNATHIRTFFYDEAARQWIALPYDTLLASCGMLTSLTTHFTDFINGIIKTPDAPETQALVSTSIKDLKAAEPSAGISVMTPPGANHQGTANLELALRTPPGRKGLEPGLALRYNSDGGNGWVGIGWDISLPSISIETRWGVPRYDDNLETETYSMMGEMLSPVIHRDQYVSRSGNSKRFYPRIEGSFRKIIRHGNSPKTYWWEVTEKNGARSFYGGDGHQVDENAVLRDEAGNIAVWALRETRDLNDNFIHYLYDVASSGAGGHQIYAESIQYTGHGTEEGHFSVHFKRESGRKDVIVNGRLGLKQVTADVLKSVDIMYQGQLVRSYRFDYMEGAFFKTLLRSVVETDRTGVEFIRHDFDYYDEVRKSGQYQPFTTPDKWVVPSDHLSGDLVTSIPGFEDDAAVTGSAQSSSESGGMSLTVGSYGSTFDKSYTVGGNFGFNGSSSDGLTALVDIDGDGKPDKVFREDGKLKYRRNLSQRDGNWMFSQESVLITGVQQFSTSKTRGSSIGVEANLSFFFVGYTWSKSKTITDTYFSDFNGDRLIDIAHKGRVYFNHLNQAGHPVFTLSSDDTPNPIQAGAPIDSSLVVVTPAELDTLIDENPLHDVVRLWEAPFDGRIQIDAPVMLVADTSQEALEYNQKDGVRVSIQQKGDIIWQKNIDPILSGITFQPQVADFFEVKKGDRFYFRVQSVFDGAYDRVQWDPLITYLDPPQAGPDPNGKLPGRYRASEDFVLTAPQQIGMPLNGMVHIGGLFRKGLTSDSLVVEVIKSTQTGSQTMLRRVFNWSDTASVELTMPDFHVDSLDNITFRVSAPTNVEWAGALSWSPYLRYVGFDNGMPSVDGQNKPLLEFRPAPDYRMHNRIEAFPQAWVAPDTGIVRINSFSLPSFGHPMINGTLTLSAKGVRKLYGRKTMQIQNGLIVSNGTSAGFSVNVDAGDVVFLEYHLENDTLLDSLYALMPIFTPHLVATIGYLGQDPEEIKAGVYIPSQEIWLGPMYRRWGFFVYNGNRDRAENPIPEDLLRKAPAEDPGSIPDKKEDIDPKYNPANIKVVMLYPDMPVRAWRGFDDLTWVTAAEISSSRLGEDNLVIDNAAASGSGATAPRKITKFKSHNFSVGQGAAGFSGTATHSDGETETLYSVQDMNGDGYPDILSASKIQFTNPLGGLEHTSREHLLGNQNGSSSQDGATFGGGGSYNIAKKSPEAGQKSNAGAATAGMNAGNKSTDATQTSTASLGLSITFSGGKEETGDAWVDVNGDGLPDKVFQNGQVSLNLGYQFAPPENWGFNGIQQSNSDDIAGGLNLGFNYEMGSIMAGLGVSKTESESWTSWQDINADGLPDQVVKFLNTGLFYVRINQGDRLSDWIRWEGLTKLDASTSLGESINVAFTVCIPIPLVFIRICFNPSFSIGQGMSRQTSMLTDVNGDGFPDFVTSNKDDDFRVQRSTIGRTNLLRSVKRPMNGSFVMHYEQTESSFRMPNARWTLDSLEVFDGLDGDGPTRTAQVFEYEGGNYNRREREFYGFNAVVSTQLNTADQDKPYRVNTQRFANENYYEKGLLLWETTVDDAGKRYLETVNTYELRDAGTGQPVSNPGVIETGSIFPALTKTEKMYYEGQPNAALSSSTLWNYDLSGNITSYVETGDGSPDDRLSAEIEYHQLPSVGLSDIPRSIRVQAGTQADIRRREADIDGRGNIVQIRQFLDPQTSADIDLVYDSHGNLSQITRPKNQEGKRMWYAFTYDTDVQTYITEIRDAYQLTSQSVYDYRYGQLLESTDANGKKIRNELDEKGRIRSITGPYEIESGKPYTIAFDYHPEAAVPYARTLHFDPENGQNIETYTFMDGLLRPVQVKKTGSLFSADGQPDQLVMIVSGASEFDAFGRTVKQYYPISEPTGQETVLNTDQSGISPTLTRFDVLDRPVSVILPDGSEQQSDYGFGDDNSGYRGFLTKTTDPKGRIMESYQDLRDRKRATRVFGSDGEIWTGFRYNALGELLTVITQENDSTRYSYDHLGRNTAVQHPDFGLNRMTFDLAGHLLAKSTPDLRERISDTALIRYTYDYDRLVQVDYPESYQNQVKYAYGAAGAPHNRAGRMWLQQDATGGQEFFFGPLGEVEKTIRTIIVNQTNQQTFVWEARYDTWNRIQQLIYPDGEKVDYGYNRAGKVTSVTGEKGGNVYPYMVQLGYDLFEQRVFARMGNGTATAYTYDEARRWLKALDVTLPDGRRIMSNQYDYDLVGNVQSLSNSVAPVSGFAELGGPSSYTFEYDPLDQLVNASGNWSGGTGAWSFSLDMEYDKRHNIVRKKQQHFRNNALVLATSHDNAYKYDGGLPHAPNSIGDRTYTYDANGNNTGWEEQGRFRKIIWNETNMPAVISDNGFVSLYTYDAGGERTLKSSGGIQQIALNGLPTGLIQHQNNYTAYVCPFLVARDSAFTKHYFIEGQRIATKLGEGYFANKVNFNHKLTAGSLDYGKRAQLLKAAADTRLGLIAVPPGTPVSQGQHHVPSANGIAYAPVFLSDSAYSIPPSSWKPGIAIGPPDPAGPPRVPVWKPPFETNDNVQAGYGYYTPSSSLPENARYFYHPDHLGSSSYITDRTGRVTQHLEYMPFGESFVEEYRATDPKMPYRFSGKEQDEETGLYYFGARFYDPQSALWLSVDPMAEKYPGWSGYNYVMQNPLKLVDPDGNQAGVSFGLSGTWGGKEGLQLKANVSGSVSVNTTHTQNTGTMSLGLSVGGIGTSSRAPVSFDATVSASTTMGAGKGDRSMPTYTVNSYTPEGIGNNFAYSGTYGQSINYNSATDAVTRTGFLGVRGDLGSLGSFSLSSHNDTDLLPYSGGGTDQGWTGGIIGSLRLLKGDIHEAFFEAFTGIAQRDNADGLKYYPQSSYMKSLNRGETGYRNNGVQKRSFFGNSLWFQEFLHDWRGIPKFELPEKQ